MFKFIIVYTSIFCLFSCSGNQTKKQTSNEAQKDSSTSSSSTTSTSSLNLNYSADAGMVFYNKNTNTWVYQPKKVHPSAVALKDLVANMSGHINDQLFADAIQTSLKNVTGKNIVAAPDFADKDLSAFEKIKILHDFVAIYLTYDAVQKIDGSFDIKGQSMRTSYKTILKNKKSVCAGYTILFDKACELARIPGVKCKIVYGLTRSVAIEEVNKKKQLVNRPIYHVWNLVDIKDYGKYLLDATWDSFIVRTGEYGPEYSSSFLFTDPKVFIYNHIPTASNNQLLAPALSEQQHRKLPNLEVEFFVQNLKLLSEINDLIIDLPIEFLDLKILNESKKPSFVIIENFDQNYKVHVEAQTSDNIDYYRIPVDQPGMYVIRLFLKSRENTELFDSVASFYINHK